MRGEAEKALNRTRAFLVRIHKDLSPPDPTGASVFQGGLTFWRADEGSLTLSTEEEEEYYACLRDLQAAVELPERVSDKTAASWLQDAIFHCLDLPSTREGTFEERLEYSMRLIESRIVEFPSEWTVWCPVEWFNSEHLPKTFGNVTVSAFSGDELQNVMSQIDSVLDANVMYDDEGKRKNKDSFHNYINRSWNEQTIIARVLVYAHDSDSAVREARRLLRILLDVINFVAYSDRYNHNLRARAYLPENGQRVVTLSVAVSKEQEGSLPTSVRGPMRSLELNQIDESLMARVNEVLSRSLISTSRRLTNNQQRKAVAMLDTTLLAALSWAGRAETASRTEEAFAFFAISLEALLLTRETKGETGYKLRIRLAYLLGKTPKERQIISGHMSRIYGARSNIFHNGDFVIDAEDVGMIRHYARAAIRVVMTSSLFASIRNTQDLDKVLGKMVYGP